MECLKSNNVEDEWNNSRNIVIEVAGGVLGEKS